MGHINLNKLTKLYYTIGEVAEMFDVNTSLIRFWEKEFTTINPKKNSKGNRVFSPKEIEKIDRIYTLVKVKGFTLDGAKKALRVKEEIPLEVSENDLVIQRLKKIREKLIAAKKA